ncbi:hypothetical protein TcG_07544 [Trypanosoma cruzi]|nr:hypothetical protein TcG_07544 [Trypanosoma cruzi]
MPRGPWILLLRSRRPRTDAACPLPPRRVQEREPRCEIEEGTRTHTAHGHAEHRHGRTRRKYYSSPTARGRSPPLHPNRRPGPRARTPPSLVGDRPMGPASAPGLQTKTDDCYGCCDSPLRADAVGAARTPHNRNAKNLTRKCLLLPLGAPLVTAARTGARHGKPIALPPQTARPRPKPSPRSSRTASGKRTPPDSAAAGARDKGAPSKPLLRQTGG